MKQSKEQLVDKYLKEALEQIGVTESTQIKSSKSFYMKIEDLIREMKQIKEQLAEKYAEENNSAYANDYCGFLEGFNSAEKQTAKIIKDLKNKYSSHLVEHQLPKLDKIINQEEVLKLKSKLELLTEIERKLGYVGK